MRAWLVPILDREFCLIWKLRDETLKKFDLISVGRPHHLRLQVDIDWVVERLCSPSSLDGTNGEIMAAIDALVNLLGQGHSLAWAKSAEDALRSAVEAIYQRGLAKSQGTDTQDGASTATESGGALAIRAPEMMNSNGSIPFAALLHHANPSSGAYGGDSFVLFPSLDATSACVVGLVVGTHGLAPDESILTSPGHARRVQGLTQWLNQSGKGLVAWAKADPSRTDIDLPDIADVLMGDWAQAAARYGQWMYFIFRPTGDQVFDQRATLAILDVFCEARGLVVRAKVQKELEALRHEIQGAVFPRYSPAVINALLRDRRFVILTGPPGTGKTHLAKGVLDKHFGGNGDVYQLHAGYTVESFVGGLAPSPNKEGRLSFKATPGVLMKACAKASQYPDKDHLLILDEINRADLAKVLGEALYLFEAGDVNRVVELPLEFEGFEEGLSIPSNLYLLGTMNSADRSIALIDLAVRRRFAFVSLWPDIDVLESQKERLGEGNAAAELAAKAFANLQKLFLDHATEEGLELMPGHSYFLVPEVSDPLGALKNKLRFELDPLLRDYLHQGIALGLSEELRAYRQWLLSQL